MARSKRPRSKVRHGNKRKPAKAGKRKAQAKARQRDYRAEYKRRIDRALSRGYTRAVARGHAPAGVVDIARAKKSGLPVGAVFVRRRADVRHDYVPTGIERRRRLEQLDLPLGDPSWYNSRKRQLISPGEYDGKREAFVAWLVQNGLQSREAYTLWFSP